MHLTSLARTGNQSDWIFLILGLGETTVADYLLLLIQLLLLLLLQPVAPLRTKNSISIMLRCDFFLLLHCIKWASFIAEGLQWTSEQMTASYSSCKCSNRAPWGICSHTWVTHVVVLLSYCWLKFSLCFLPPTTASGYWPWDFTGI